MGGYIGPPTAGIATGTENAARMTRSKNLELNNNFVFTGDANLKHTPEFYVRIFNVAEKEQRVERPWVHPGRLGQCIIIPACEHGKPFSKPFVIPDIIQMKVERPGSWDLSTRGVDGKFLAQDALDPDDMRGNWRTHRRKVATVGSNEGTDLYNWGCFWTTNEEPSAEELEAANKNLDLTCNELIEQAKMLWMGGAQERRQVGNTHRFAAAHFGMSFEWNQLYTKKRECEGCGHLCSETAVICPNCPATFNWEKALSLGLRTVAQAVAAGIMEPQAEVIAGIGEKEEAPAPKKRKPKA
jgi:hypothetical protein